MSAEPQSIGPYRLLGLLGRGAMGAVYRAERSQDGQLVALKTMKTPWAALLPRIRSEIHALGRLRHPGVVQILDSGAQDGVPWYAMELIQGPTLREHAGRLDLSRPAELLELLNVVRRLCTALAYVHGEGIVHRDLKPDNIILRNFEFSVSNSELERNSAQRAEIQNSKLKIQNPGWPVLVDFGVLTEWPGALGRENLAADAARAGTPLYMAPEQLRGEMVDARADLYSLGCLLYELLAGRPPFEGKVWEVCEAHLHTPARPLPELAPWVPAGLDELVRRLLEKEPSRRMGYATDVAVALTALGADDGAQESGPEPQAYLYRPGFVGRSRTLEALDGHLARLTAGAGAVLLIGGESGVGKTRLLKELELRARARGIRVLTGECLPPAGPAFERAGAGGGPLQALSRPLRALGDWCRQQGAGETVRLLGRRGRVLARYEPTLLELPGIQEAAEPPDLPAEPARMQLFEALVASFTAFAHRKPLLVALDDLQWADELTAGWLEFLVQREETGAASLAPLLLVGTYRSEEAGDVLERIAQAPRTTHLSLERLGAEPLGAMAGEMLAMERLSELFVRFLSRRSAGNPFFVGEYLRAAVAEGVLYRDEKGCWQVADESQAPATEAVFEALPLPGSVRELVARRLRALGPSARRVVDVAAVFGREVEAAVLGRASGMGEERRLAALRELLVKQVLEEPEPGRLRFAHDQIREAAYTGLGRARRRKLHGMAAAALEAHHGMQSAEHQAALGQHWEQAGVQERARDCYLGAARHAVGRYALGEAERLYRAYLTLVDRPTPESVAARNELARQVLYFQGRADEGIEALGQAVKDAQSLADLPLRATSLYQLAVLYQKTGRIDAGRDLCLEALAIERQLGHRAGEGRALNLLGIFEAEQGRPEAALAAYEAALAIDRERGDRLGEVKCLGNLANIYCDQGRLAESSALQERALARVLEIRDPFWEGLVLGNLGNVYAVQGRLAEARALHERALAIHNETGRRASAGIVLCNLGFVCRMQGDLETSRRLFEQGIAIDREVGNRRGESIHVTQFAATLHDSGSPEQALAALASALEIAREVRDPRIEAYALYEEARLGRRMAPGPTPAADRLQKAEAILENFEDRLGMAQCVIERGHIALASGAPVQDLLQSAREMVATFGVGPDSEVGRALARLESAAEAFALGRPLFRGECPADLPAGLQRWLEERGELRPAGA